MRQKRKRNLHLKVFVMFMSLCLISKKIKSPCVLGLLLLEGPGLFTMTEGLRL